MRWKTGKKQSESWQLLIVPKPLFLGTVLMKKTLSFPLSGNLTGLTKRKRLLLDECTVCKVWIIMECQCLAEDSKVRVYLSKVRKSKWQAARRFIKKAVPYVLRLFGTIALTYLYSVYSIEQAFVQRGYRAYGG